jgi:hypothetical protein
MNSGLITSSIPGPLLAEINFAKHWVDLVLIVAMFGLVVFVVGRASRRY